MTVEEFLARLAPVWRPHSGQREFLAAQAPVRVLACGRRWGKTDACAAAVLAKLLGPEPARQILVAPTVDQAALLFERVVGLYDALSDREPGLPGLKIRRTPYPTLRCGRQVVSARSAHVPRLLRGHEATHILVDEAAYVPDAVVADVLMPMLAVTDGSLTLVSTPRGRGLFWRLFQLGQSGGAEVWSRQAPTEESPHVSRRYLEAQRRLISERAYRVEYGAEFADEAGRVFSEAALQACLAPEPSEFSPPFTVGVDWGRYKDFTAVAVIAGDRSSCRLVEAVRFHAPTWDAIVGRVAAVVSRYPGAAVHCDRTGLGEMPSESLAGALPGCAVHGHAFTQASKGAMVDTLAWLIEARAIRLPPDPDLLRELEHFEAVHTGAGYRLAARPGYHDDLVAALVLAAAHLPHSYSARIATSGRRGGAA